MQDPSLEGVSIKNLCKQLYSANITYLKRTIEKPEKGVRHVQR